MSFRRTESGLSNLHLFYNSDAVVYLEGGKSIRKEDVESEIYTESSEDIRYWQTVFDIYRPEKKYEFRSIGSKKTVKSIAQDIMNGNVRNVIVAMDRDFDNIKGEIISSDNVIYTFGYSWENDAWNQLSLIESFCTLSGSCKTKIEKEIDVIKEYFNNISIILRRAVLMDAILSQYNDSLFDREKYIRYIHIERNSLPKINRKQIQASLGNARKRAKRPIVRKSNFKLSTFTDCFGHLFAECSYRILSYLLNKTGDNPKIAKEWATSMIVEKFGQLMKKNLLPELKQHYDREFVRVMC
jgi:hypothetical protein